MAKRRPRAVDVPGEIHLEDAANSSGAISRTGARTETIAPFPQTSMPPSAGRLVGRLVDRARVGHIEAQGESLAPHGFDLARCRRQAISITREHPDPRTLFSERQRDRRNSLLWGR